MVLANIVVPDPPPARWFADAGGGSGSLVVLPVFAVPDGEVGMSPDRGWRGGGADLMAAFCALALPSRRRRLRRRCGATELVQELVLPASAVVLRAASLVCGWRQRSWSRRMDRWLQIDCFFPTWLAWRIRFGNRDSARGISPVDVPHRQRLRRLRRASPSTLKASDGDGAASAPARKVVRACRPPRPFFVFLFLLGCFLHFLPGSCLLPVSLDVSACLAVIFLFG